MAQKIAINGFGRIGRLTLRYLLERDDVEVVAVNDLTQNDMLAHLFKFDSAQGTYEGVVTANDSDIMINGTSIRCFSERDPANLPWADLGVDVVLECTGVFRSAESAGKHLQAGASKVVISAPAKGGDVQTMVLGVNDDQLDPSQSIFSNASCTTNCLAPVVKILHEAYGIESGNMTTIHAYTADQRMQDAPHSDWRRARAAAVNIVPTSTGAASAVGKVYPPAKDKLIAIAVRVPVITGSMIELTCKVDRPATVEDINARFKAAAEGPMKGILYYSEFELVSSDIIGKSYSSVFDSKLTAVKGDLVKVVSWYDNEAGYAARLADMCALVAGTIS
ncbi:MAG: type I glyceraldehyde-3-phosphate dehydrogenase [Saprospiraceae bacterium]|nr:type I glyceraldehyde-3-phosphate dehydrogenase [Saprospiraceae bacterium]